MPFMAWPPIAWTPMDTYGLDHVVVQEALCGVTVLAFYLFACLCDRARCCQKHNRRNEIRQSHEGHESRQGSAAESEGRQGHDIYSSWCLCCK